MVKLTVMYPYQEDFTFDFDYYINHHIVIHKADPNALGIIVEKGCNAFRGGGTPGLVCVAHFFYESIGTLNESRTPEKGRANWPIYLILLISRQSTRSAK